MDRDLSPSFRRKQRLTLALKIAAPLAVLATGLVYAAGVFSASVERSRVRTAVVERGSIEAVIEASGTIIPDRDRVLTSPVEAQVLKILKRAGERVQSGEAIVLLDVGASNLALEKLKDNITLKANAQAQLAATLEGKLISLENRISLKRRDCELDSNKYEQNLKLFEKNYVSRVDVSQFELQFQKSKDELQALLKEQTNTRTAARLQQEGIALEITILKKERAQSVRELDQAAAKAASDGVVTWVVQTEGLTVRKGDVIAKMADLSSYRADANVSDVHRGRLVAGMPVRVRVGDVNATAAAEANTVLLDGRISNILPTIENGVVKLTIALNEPANRLLQSNLRVDVFIVTDRRMQALRVKKGTFARGSGRQDVFVLRGDRAVRVTATLGLAGADYYEVLDGLREGDELIISDMRDYEHLKEVKIK